MNQLIAATFRCLVYGMLVPIYLLPFLNATAANTLVRRASIFVLVVVPSLKGFTYLTLAATKIL